MLDLEAIMQQAITLANSDIGDYVMMASAPILILVSALYGGRRLGEYLELREYKKNPERPRFKL